VFKIILEKVVKQLSKFNIPYMVIGGQAVLLYGEPRLTRDIDITLGVKPDEVKTIMDIVKNIGLKILVKDVEEFVIKTFVLPAIDEKSGIRVDFIFSVSSYERKAIERAKAINLGKTKVRFASLEDLIIHKIIARRPRDIEDVRSILLKNPDYDGRYIVKWLKKFDSSLNENFYEVFKNLKDEIDSGS
jgi:predicted nucleotidyltransferase